jgi:hypothetical protein
LVWELTHARTTENTTTHDDKTERSRSKKDTNELRVWRRPPQSQAQKQKEIVFIVLSIALY